MKELWWVGNSFKDFGKFPEEVQTDMGFALRRAREGKTHYSAKPLKGFGGASVLEIVESHDGNAYRAVYTVKFKDRIYVLHSFQKKSKRGVKTPKKDMDLIGSRLKELKKEQKERRKKK